MDQKFDQAFVNYNLDLKAARIRNGTENGVEANLGYKCVQCGKHVSGRVVDFHDGDVERVRCYECQDKN